MIEAARAGAAAREASRRKICALARAWARSTGSRLKDYKSATAAFEVCVSLDPRRHRAAPRSWQRALSAVGAADTYDKAVKEYRYPDERDTGLRNADGGLHRRRLRRLLLEMQASTTAPGASPRRWSYLRKADPEEQQFFDQYRPKGFVRARALTEELWRRNIYHPDEDRYISAIFAGRQPGGRRRARQGAQGLGAEAQGQARPRHRPAAVQQGVQLREPGGSTYSGTEDAIEARVTQGSG